MKNLLYKEFRLALHPAAAMFLALSALVLIPNYPYTVTFFYSCLGALFICQSGRENKDIFYSMQLPVPKGHIVKARFTFICLLQIAQLVCLVPFLYLRTCMAMQPNQVGLDANWALPGYGLLLLGVFNFVFFVKYYKNTDKVGSSFLWGAGAMALLMVVLEASVHVFPSMQQLNAMGNEGIVQYLFIILIGAAVYAACTLLAYRKSVQSFEKLDL